MELTHDGLVLAYLQRLSAESPLLFEQIERAKLLAQRDLMQQEIDRLKEAAGEKPLQAVADAKA